MSQRKSLSGMKLGKLSRLGRGGRAMLEGLEGRRLFAVSVLNAIGDVTLYTGITGTTTLLGNVFGTDNLNSTQRAYHGSVVEFVITRNDSSGQVSRTFDLELDDLKLSDRSSAVATVKNFLNYVNNGSYNNSVFHRSLNFSDNTKTAQFLQGGGFTTNSTGTLSSITESAPINLDYNDDRPNVAGTISMARTSDPDSATSGFFFNTQDNSSDFDQVGNQYAVFGQVIGTGQQTLTELSNLLRINAMVPVTGQPAKEEFDGFPVSNYPSGTTPSVSNYVIVQTATLKDQLTFKVTSSNSAVIQAAVSSDGVVTLSRPSAAAFGTANITVTATDLNGLSNSVTFKTTALAPKLAVTVNGAATTSGQAAVNFGTVLRGAALTEVLGLSNGGNAALSINSVTLPKGYSLQPNAPTSLAAGDSVSLTLAVDTSLSGSKAGNIVVNSNDVASPVFTVPVTSTVNLTPGLRVTVNGTNVVGDAPATTDFGQFQAGKPLTESITLSNTGDAVLTISSVDLPAGYSLTGTLPVDVPANGSIGVTLSLDTTLKSGLNAGNIVFHSNYAEIPAFTVPVSATTYRQVVLDNKTIKSVVFTESDGTKGIITLTGPGLVTLQFGGIASVLKTVKGVATLTTAGVTLSSVALSGTNSKSVVTLTASGKNKQISLGGLTISGAKSSVGTLNLAPAVLTGTGTIGGLIGSLSLAGITNGTLTIGASSVGGKPKTALALGNLLNGFVDVLTNGTTTVTASSLNTTDLVARTGLASVAVSGTVLKSQIEAGTTITSFSAKVLNQSKVLAGTMGAGVDGTGPTPTTQTELGKGSIGSVTLTAKSSSFSGSVIAAAKLGHLTLGGLPTSSKTPANSIIANLITSFAGTVGGKVFSLTSLNDSTSLKAALKSARLTLPTNLTVTIY